MRATLSSICALSLVLPSPLLRSAGAAPSTAEEKLEESPPTGDDTKPSAPAGGEADPTSTTPSDVGGVTREDDLHDAMVQAFTDRFQEGKFLFNRGSYTQAAAEFERAFAAIPAEAALFNVALSYERGGDRVSAAIAARSYLELPACDAPGVDPALCGARRGEVEKQLERLMAQISELRLEIAKGVALREISVNGRKVAIGDFPILVAAGRIDIELVGAQPGQRRQRVVEVRPGERQAITVGPFDVPDPDPRGTSPRETKQRPKWLKPLFWSGLGLTAASGIALATMGGLLLREDKRYYAKRCDTMCPPNPNNDDMYPHEEEHRRGQYRLATNVLVGVTAGIAMITTVVGLFAFTGEDARRKRNAGTQRASTRVRWLGAGVLVHY
jgi:hypothetical protein